MRAAELELHTEDVDPFLRWFHRRALPPSLLLLFFPIVGALLALVTAAQGEFAPAQGISIVYRDFLQITHIRKSKSDPNFPLLRDYPSIINVAAAAATLFLAYRNCRLMNSFAAELHKSGLLKIPAESTEPVLDEVRKANRRFLACGHHSWTVAVPAVATATLLMGAYHLGGAFFVLSPDGDAAARSAWSQNAYDSWWASLSPGHSLGAAAYWLVASVIGYIMIKHNLMGLCIILFFVGINKHVRYGADTYNLDGRYGWDPMRKILGTVILAVVISIIAFGSLFTEMSPRNIEWTAPLLILYITGVPMYFFAPMLLLKKAMQRFRESAIEETHTRFSRARSKTSPLSVEFFQLERLERDEIASLHSLKVRLFNVRQIIATFAVYAGSLVASLARIFMK